MPEGDRLSAAILSLLFVGVCSEECKSFVHCESLITRLPSCKVNSSIVECFTNSCEAYNPAVQLNIQAYETAEDVLCRKENEHIRKAFEGMFKCWMTAVSCSWLHLVADTAENTRQICIVRRRSMRSCKSLGEESCHDVIGNFTDALNKISACRGTKLIAHVTLVLSIGSILLALRSNQ